MANKTIQIDSKHYDVESLTDNAKKLLAEINAVDGEINRLNLQTAISNLARKTLVNTLIEEAKNLTEVEAPAKEEEEK